MPRGKMRHVQKAVVKKIYVPKMERGVEVQVHIADELECGHRLPRVRGGSTYPTERVCKECPTYRKA